MERPEIDLTPKVRPRNCPNEIDEYPENTRERKVVEVKRSGTPFNEMKRVLERRKKDDELMQYNYQNEPTPEGIHMHLFV